MKIVRSICKSSRCQHNRFLRLGSGKAMQVCLSKIREWNKFWTDDGKNPFWDDNGFSREDDPAPDLNEVPKDCPFSAEHATCQR